MRYTAITILLFAFSFSVSTSFSQNLSDEEIKTNITVIREPLKSITSLEPRRFEYNTGDFNHLKLPKGSQYGFITEEFEQVFPSLVYKKQFSYMRGKNIFKSATIGSVDLEGLVPVLVAAVKEQQAQIESLRSEIAELRRRK